MLSKFRLSFVLGLATIAGAFALSEECRTLQRNFDKLPSKQPLPQTLTALDFVYGNPASQDFITFKTEIARCKFALHCVKEPQKTPNARSELTQMHQMAQQVKENVIVMLSSNPYLYENCLPIELYDASLSKASLHLPQLPVDKITRLALDLAATIQAFYSRNKQSVLRHSGSVLYSSELNKLVLSDMLSIKTSKKTLTEPTAEQQDMLHFGEALELMFRNSRPLNMQMIIDRTQHFVPDLRPTIAELITGLKLFLQDKPIYRNHKTQNCKLLGTELQHVYGKASDALNVPFLPIQEIGIDARAQNGKLTIKHVQTTQGKLYKGSVYGCPVILYHTKQSITQFLTPDAILPTYQPNFYENRFNMKLVGIVSSKTQASFLVYEQDASRPPKSWSLERVLKILTWPFRKIVQGIAFLLKWVIRGGLMSLLSFIFKKIILGLLSLVFGKGFTSIFN